MSPSRKFLLSGFIFFNLMGMARCFMPLDYTFFKTVYWPVDHYLSFFSLYQDWMMFAPNPGKLNVALKAEIEFTDGSKEAFLFPDSSKLSLTEKYRFGEKYRKIISESLSRQNHAYLWSDSAKFALRKVRLQHLTKIPYKVDLIRLCDEIPNLSSEFRPHQHSPDKFQETKMYSYEVI